MKKTNLSLTIGWLYPDLMSTYGDRGNIICFSKRCEWKGIKTKILKIQQDTPLYLLKSINFLFGGGAQDKQQEIVMNDLKGMKKKIIKNLIENNIPSLFVCGSPQLMGEYYETADNKILEGLNIFDIYTKNPSKSEKRFIGNIVAKLEINNLNRKFIERDFKEIYLVGFENHGGRTYLRENVKPLARVIKGYGNNGADKTEGIIYKNAIGTYLHGPFLSKNPEITDYLINAALYSKYKKIIKTKIINNDLETLAKKSLI
jgi:CobQ-like glutamine amidotransferase family enzyme